MVQLSDIFAAQKTIAGHADNTPLIPSPFLSQKTGQQVLLKLEITQPMGAFKLRGAINAITRLDDQAVGVTCCSTGNHGRAVAYAAQLRGLRAVVCMSSLVPKAKVEGVKQLGAIVRIVGQSQDDAMAESDRLSREQGFVEISPFDDENVIAGQGTIGLEILRDRPDISTLLVPLSGGGLAAGICVAAKAINPDITIIGISMDRGAAMAASIRAQRPVELDEVASLADSLGGGIGMNNKLSYPLCRDMLDQLVLVTEEEIYRAMQALYFEDRLVAEGASVVGVAALLSGKVNIVGPTATIITGRNLDMNLFTNIIAGNDVLLGEYHVKGQHYAR